VTTRTLRVALLLVAALAIGSGSPALAGTTCVNFYYKTCAAVGSDQSCVTSTGVGNLCMPTP
jgi:hypothetical protein